MDEAILVRKIMDEFSSFTLCKKTKQYYTAQVFRGRCEAYLELYLQLGYKEDSCNVIQHIFKAIRGF